jgi:hypothetical protein
MRRLSTVLHVVATRPLLQRPSSSLIITLPTHTAQHVSTRRASSSTAPIDAKLARVFVLDLNRLRSEYRRQPSLEQQQKCIREATQVPLSRITGLDGKVIAQYVSTLASFGIRWDHPALEAIGSWMVGNPTAFSVQALATSLYSLRQLRYPDLGMVLDGVQNRLTELLPEASPASLVLLFDTMLFAGWLESAPAVGTEILTAMSSAVPQLSESEAVLTLHSIAQLGNRAGSIGVDQEMKRLLGSVWHELRHVKLASSALQQQQQQQGGSGGGDSPAPNSSVYGSLQTKDVALLVVALVQLFNIGGGAVEGNDSFAGSVSTSIMMKSELSELVEELCKSFRLEELRRDRSSLRMVQDCLRRAKPLNGDLFPQFERALKTSDQPTSSELSSSSWSVPQLDRLWSQSHDLSAVVMLLDKENGTMSHLTETTTTASDDEEEVRLIRQWVSDRIQEVHKAATCSSSSSGVGGGGEKNAPPAPPAASSSGPYAAQVISLLSVATLRSNLPSFVAIIDASAKSWTLVQWMALLQQLSLYQTKESRELLRVVAPHLIPLVPNLSASQLGVIGTAYGRAVVRHDALCDAIALRITVLGKEASLYHISTILTVLAAVEYRMNRAFLDLAPIVFDRLHSANALLITNLIVAYAKLLVWNYRLFAALAKRAYAVKAHLEVPQLLSILTAFVRMDFKHDLLLQYTLEQVHRQAATLPLPRDAVQAVSCLSRSYGSMVGAAGGSSPHPAALVELFDLLAGRFIAEKELLSAAQLGEVLLSYARTGLSVDRIFPGLTLRVLAVAPTAAPVPTSHIATAFAMAQQRHDELFSVIADRLTNNKHDYPAVVIGSILAAFASLQIRDDRLFVEMIPRVRHVAFYGSPIDIANVVVAYSSVQLWHYKLFAKLADRAIAVRNECRVEHLTKILGSFGAVGMRYEKLFTELAPRVQVLAHLLTIHQIRLILEAYGKVAMFDPAVFSVLGDRAAEMAEMAAVEELEGIACVYEKGNVPHEHLESVLKARNIRTNTTTGQPQQQETTKESSL